MTKYNIDVSERDKFINKVAQFYRELMNQLTERLCNGESDINTLISSVRERVVQTEALTRIEVEDVVLAVRRDLEKFVRSYHESWDHVSDSVFMSVIKKSLWQELADITDKTQLEWREVFQDLNHHGVYHSGEVVDWGDWSVRNVITVSPSTRLRYCRIVQNVGTTSSSASLLNRNAYPLMY